MQPLPLAAWICATLALATAAQPAAPVPEYVVEPCCNLCPAAANRAAYSTKFLQSFTTLMQGRDGWLFRSDDDLRTTFNPTDEGLRELRRLRNALKARGVDLVMVVQPSRGLMHADKLPASERKRYGLQLARVSYGATLERYRKLGIVVPKLEGLIYESGPQAYFFRGDHHWTPYGAQRTAQIVAETVRTLPSYKAIQKKKFVTERSGLFMKKGTMYKAATQLCGFGYAEQYVDRYITAPEGAEADLLGDASVPQAALVGTSNSDNAYNFAGFLSEHLGLEVLNESVAGGGHDGGLLQYLPAERFQKTPPKILIWELETYHNLSERAFYRQIVPLVYNGCQGRHAALSKRTALRTGKNEVLFNGGGQVLPLVSRKHLLDLQFSEPVVTEFKVQIWYTNGSKDTVTIKDSAHVDRGGRYALELRSDGDWADRTFLSLDLELPEGTPSGVSLTAQVCSREDEAAPRRTAEAR